MSEEFTELQLNFSFAETDEPQVHGGPQIAAPVDNSLIEDEEDEQEPPFDPDEESGAAVINGTDEEPSAAEPESVSIQEPEPADAPRVVYSEFARHAVVQPPAPETVPTQVPEQPSAATPSFTPAPVRTATGLQQKDLQCAALGWLATFRPTAAAIRVPTRLAKFRADAAAFWSTPKKNRLLQPEKTVLIEARLTRNSCWPECSGSEEIVPELRREQAHRQALEAEIRRTEPHLLDSDVLFPEIEYWNYEGTRNPAYRESLRRIRSYEKALYRGSRFERIRRADVANELYLAVPEGLIHPDELAEGWGLLYVTRNLSVKIAKPAAWIDCPQENMLHLSQNIAASSLNDVLFAHGIGLTSGGRVQFHCPPRRRRIRPLI